MIRYKLIRSKRKTCSLTVTDEGPVVRAPRFMPRAAIDLFVKSHADWIEKKTAQRKTRAANAPAPLTEDELKALKKEAKRVIPARVAYWAPKVGVTYGRVAVRAQHTRWGSCSTKGNLNFNCLLMLTPEEVRDSVIVHELCHRKEMNHSRRFYAEVLRVMPEYKKHNKWLKQNGPAILARLPR